MDVYVGNCVVCSNKGYLDKDNVCTKCRHILNEEAPEVALYNLEGAEQQVKELEKRIPDLFVGATCPLDFYNGDDCTCTNICKALKYKANKNSWF